MSEKHVLLIDDNQTVGRLFELFLARSGFSQVTLCFQETVEGAVDHLQSFQPELILLDNYLGAYESYHRPLEILREHTAAPVILITGSSLEEMGYRKLPEELAGFVSKQELTVERFADLLAEYFSLPPNVPLSLEGEIEGMTY